MHKRGELQRVARRFAAQYTSGDLAQLVVKIRDQTIQGSFVANGKLRQEQRGESVILHDRHSYSTRNVTVWAF